MTRGAEVYAIIDAPQSKLFGADFWQTSPASIRFAWTTVAVQSVIASHSEFGALFVNGSAFLAQ